MESKHAESKVGEGKATEPSDGSDLIGVLPGMGEDQSVMARACQWFGKKGKLSLLDDFAREHWHEFRAEAERDERDRGSGAGIDLALDACHRRFLEEFERQLERFIREEGSSLEEFDKEAHEVRMGKSLTLFACDDVDHRRFLDTLLSSLDFEHFYGVMLKAVQQHGKVGKVRSGGGKSSSKK